MGFETVFADKCRSRSQELLALRPTGSGASTSLERVGGQGTGGEGVPPTIIQDNPFV